MKLISKIALFLIINFGCLAIGSWLMDNGPQSQWYIALNKAPWTPQGWVFGAAWTTIMVCFSIYLGHLFLKSHTIKLYVIYGFQIFFNVIWNYLFFNKHLVALALIVIILLTITVFIFFFYNKKQLKNKSYLLLPYMLWLLIATSLNAYILIYN